MEAKIYEIFFSYLKCEMSAVQFSSEFHADWTVLKPQDKSAKLSGIKTTLRSPKRLKES
jgi:hypothetical protein